MTGALRVLRRFLRWMGIVIVVAGVALFGRAVLVATTAHAGSDSYHPAYCLGGWSGPKHASGAPDLSSDAGVGEFTTANSAFLEPDVASQLFCGYFGAEARERPATSVTLTFRWNFGPSENPGSVWDAVHILPPAEDAPPDTPSPAPLEEAGPQGGSPGEGASAPASSEELSPPAETTVPPSDTTAPPEPTPTEPAPETPPGEEVPVPPPAGGAESSFKPGVLWELFGIKTAHAAEPLSLNALSLLDVLEVSYSFDGVRWHAGGRVNAHNWQNFAVTIPFTSWEELQSLQIMVAALPSFGYRPPIYIESVTLAVDNDRTLAEAVGDSAEAVGDVVSGALALADSVTESLVGLVIGTKELVAAPPAPREGSSAEAHGLVYAVAGEPVGADRLLPWLPDSMKKNLSGKPLPAPQVEVLRGGAELRVSGSCASAYFVVLTYRNAEDYKKSPRSFASNYAGPCVDGAFTYSLAHLPLNTPPGTYYLLLAEQGEDGPWVPSSALLPVTIDVRTN